MSFTFTHGNPYNLNGTKTDACFHPSRKAATECLQELIESYYGKPFTTYCQEFPHILAESRCTGCPWDRLDPKKINPDIAEEYQAAGNQSELFHEANADCTTSKYAREFGTYDGVFNYAVRWGIFASIPILFSTGTIVQYTFDSTGLTRPSILGWKVHEWMFMAAVWVSYIGGILLLSTSREYYYYCDSTASIIGIEITHSLSYVVLIYYSLCRCRQLYFPQNIFSLDTGNRAQRNYNTNTSWYAFVTDKEGMSWKKYIRSKKAVAFYLVYGCSFAVPLIYIAETLGTLDINYYNFDVSPCTRSSVDTSARVIAIAKLILEPLVYIVYSFGASTRSKVVYRIRYVVLALIAGLCVTITFLMTSKRLHRPDFRGYLFSGVTLGVVTQITEISHVLTVSIFGLLEPLRYGSIYPHQE